MSRLNKKAYPRATLTLDFGGSGTKGIVQIQGSTPNVLYMEPEVIEVPRTSLMSKTQNNLCNAYPENAAWVGVGEQYRAVGYLAQTAYVAPSFLRPRKYELAVYKTLAAVWVVKQKYKLPAAFDLSLALLLPPGEFEDSYLLEPMLKEALLGFDTPTGELRVNLTSYECFPEGGGIYMMYCKNKGENAKRWTIAIVQVGYRNASVLVSRRGVLDKGKTTNLGMARMVDLVMERTSGLLPNALAVAIASSGSDPKPHHFLGLVAIADAEQRMAQVEKIVAAVQSARTEYAIALTSWLQEVLPAENELSGVVVCGGTADYLKNELLAAFKSTTLVWHGEVQVPAELDKHALGSRLADVYALSEYHAASVKARAKAVAKQPTDSVGKEVVEHRG